MRWAVRHWAGLTPKERSLFRLSRLSLRLMIVQDRALEDLLSTFSFSDHPKIVASKYDGRSS